MINKPVSFAVLGLLLAMIMGVNVSAAARKPEPQAPLTDAGNLLLAKYSAMLKGMQADIGQLVPKIDEQEKSTFQKSREATRAAEVQASATQAALDANKSVWGLLNQRKGWVSKAAKNVAAAQAKIKQATTADALKAAQQELANAQADGVNGANALKVTQEAADKAKIEEPKLTQANQAAQAALTLAQSNELMAAKAILTTVEPFLSSDKLDSKLVKCALLVNATPRGLAEFAEQGKDHEALVAQLLANDVLMKQMLEAGGAKAGKYGHAMEIYTAIQKASPRAKEGIFQRLALGVSLEHAVPVAQNNPQSAANAPAYVDPVKRYVHYEKAYLDGELDPAFKELSSWEYRMVVNCDAPDEILAWGRQMLRNYRPDIILTANYGWRYSLAVRTDVSYIHSDKYKDTESLEFFQNVIKNGGICGRRAFFGRFIVQSFGIPSWGVTQHAHAALSHWTPAGWVINLGAGWQWSWFDGRTGPDFLLETQARKYPQDYLKVLRAQWAGDVLGEPKYDSFKPTTSGMWNLLAIYEKKAIVAVAKPAELAPLGEELAEANESKSTQAETIAEASITAADKTIVIGQNGVITIPAVANSKPKGHFASMKSFAGGMQLHCAAGFTAQYEFETPHAGKYTLAARVVTVHEGQKFRIAANDSKEPIEIVVPYTIGLWQQTTPIELSLAKGKNVLHFTLEDASHDVTIKDFTLTPSN